MATLTLKNVPDELYARLKRQAAEHRRSLNQEAIAQLEAVIEPARSEDAVVGQISRFTAELAAKGIWVRPGDAERWIDEGRD